MRAYFTAARESVGNGLGTGNVGNTSGAELRENHERCLDCNPGGL
jgi:hypothetical protein